MRNRPGGDIKNSDGDTDSTTEKERETERLAERKWRDRVALQSGVLPALSLPGVRLRLAPHMFNLGVAGLKGPALASSHAAEQHPLLRIRHRTTRPTVQVSVP